MTRTALVGLIVATVCLNGCASRKDAPAASQPAQIHESADANSPKTRHKEQFESTLNPRVAAQTAAKAINVRFGLLVGSGGSYSGDPAYTASGDYFSASTSAMTQRFGTIDIDCEWVAEGKTRVEIRSDMPEAQYKLISSEVKRVLMAATTQPTALDPAR